MAQAASALPSNKKLDQLVRAGDGAALNAIYDSLNKNTEKLQSLAGAIHGIVKAMIESDIKGETSYCSETLKKLIANTRNNELLTSSIADGIVQGVKIYSCYPTSDTDTDESYQDNIFHMLRLPLILAQEPAMIWAAQRATMQIADFLNEAGELKFLPDLIKKLKAHENLLELLHDTHLRGCLNELHDSLALDPIGDSFIFGELRDLGDSGSLHIYSLFERNDPLWFLTACDIDPADRKSFLTIANLPVQALAEDFWVKYPDIKKPYNDPDEILLDNPEEIIWVGNGNADDTNTCPGFLIEQISKDGPESATNIAGLFRLVSRAATLHLRTGPGVFATAPETLAELADIALRHEGLLPKLPKDVREIIHRFAGPSGAG